MPKPFPHSSAPFSKACRTSPRTSIVRPAPCRLFSRTPSGLLAQLSGYPIDELYFSLSRATLFSNTGRRRDGGRASGTNPDGFNGGANNGDHKPPDPRVVKLGKTLRKLSPLLPNILINPLPAEILSPQITLHLFPSTHPHLPNVKGRVLYRAALWTVPVVWSSLPLVGNVKLQITSERMVRTTSVLGCEHTGDCGEERLVVRWKTEARGDADGSPTAISTTPSSSASSSSSSSSHISQSRAGTNKGLSALLGGEAPIFSLGKEGHFNGLFIFGFDEDGRIVSHTIEHADQADGWDRTAKFVTLTDWLLGKARSTIDPTPEPSLAAQGCEDFHVTCDRRYSRDSTTGQGRERH